MQRQAASQAFKAKLSSLSSATASSLSSLSSSSTLGSSASPNRRVILPWQRRNLENDDDVMPDTDPERLAEVMDRVICQAGVDYETRPMVVITAAALPDPREISYDLLLSCILSTLDLYVESDYTVVFLASGGKFTPGWNWVWKAYRSLSRTYRKNLKKLYIVHSTLFSKMLVSLAGAVISPKFFRKINYVGSLSALARVIPITQINIAPEVYRENLKYENKITLPTSTEAAVFGVPLDRLMGDRNSSNGVPVVLRDCVDYLRRTSLDVEGLFRRSPNSVLLRQAQEAYDRGHPVSLASFGDPHIAAVLLKKFFHDLPEPVFPDTFYPIIRRCPQPSDDPLDISSVTYVRENILRLLPQHTADVLGYVLHLLHDVSIRSHVNKMDAQNLAICFLPNLVASKNPMVDVQMCSLPTMPSMSSPAATPTLKSPVGRGPTTLASVIKLCIERYFEIFDDDRLNASDVPSRSLSSSLPFTASTGDGDEDIDDGILVMNVETSPSSRTTTTRKFVPGHGRTGTKDSNISLGSLLSDNEGSATITDHHEVTGVTSQSRTSTSRRSSRSLLPAEKPSDSPPGRQSIPSRAGSRMLSGSGVESVNVMASGFFVPPASSSPKAGR